MIEAAQACTLPNCFDPTSASQAFAQFAGVLTGFGVAAFVLVVQRVEGLGRADPQRCEAERPVFALLASVGLLAMATFTYGVVAGVEGPGAKSQSLYLVATATFVMAAVVLLYALWILLDPIIAGGAGAAVRVGVSTIMVALSAYTVVTAADVSEDAFEVGQIFAGRMVPMWSAFVMLVLLAVASTLFGVVKIKFDPHTAVPLFGLGTAVAMVAVFATWVATMKSLDAALPVGALYAIVVATIAVVAAAVLALGERH